MIKLIFTVLLIKLISCQSLYDHLSCDFVSNSKSCSYALKNPSFATYEAEGLKHKFDNGLPPFSMVSQPMDLSRGRHDMCVTVMHKESMDESSTGGALNVNIVRAGKVRASVTLELSTKLKYERFGITVYNGERLEVAMASSDNVKALYLRRIMVTDGFCDPESKVVALAIAYEQLRESLVCDFAVTKSSCNYKVNLYNLKVTDEGLEGTFDGLRENNIMSGDFTYYNRFCYSIIWKPVSPTTNSLYTRVINSVSGKDEDTHRMQPSDGWTYSQAPFPFTDGDFRVAIGSDTPNARIIINKIDVSHSTCSRLSYGTNITTTARYQIPTPAPWERFTSTRRPGSTMTPSRTSTYGWQQRTSTSSWAPYGSSSTRRLGTTMTPSRTSTYGWWQGSSSSAWAPYRSSSTGRPGSTLMPFGTSTYGWHHWTFSSSRGPHRGSSTTAPDRLSSIPLRTEYTTSDYEASTSIYHARQG